MKKLITLLALVGLSAVAAPRTATVVLDVGAVSNVVSGYALVTSVSMAANATNTVVSLYDNNNANFVRTNAAYTLTTSYATNQIVCWTNYFLATNCWTNITLIDVSSTVAAATNSLAPKVSVSSAASTTTTMSPVAYVFNYGIWATNTSDGIGTLTITYLK